jgi:hypothetical protein
MSFLKKWSLILLAGLTLSAVAGCGMAGGEEGEEQENSRQEDGDDD